jgi:hypothetical protein
MMASAAAAAAAAPPVKQALTKADYVDPSQVVKKKQINRSKGKNALKL